MKPTHGRRAVLGTVIVVLAPTAVAWGFGSVPLRASAASSAIAIHEGPPSCATPSYCYAPGQVTINSGDTVTWNNASDAPHTITRCTPAACAGVVAGSGPDGGLSSSQLAAGQTFSFTFHGAGTYAYYCTVHGFAVMHGTVTVAAASPPPPATTPALAPPPPASSSPAQPAPPTAPTLAPVTAPPEATSPAGAQGAAPTPRTGLLPDAGELGMAGGAAVLGVLLVGLGRRRR